MSGITPLPPQQIDPAFSFSNDRNPLKIGMNAEAAEILRSRRSVLATA